MITLSELARREFYDRSVAYYILQGYDLHSARLMAAERTANTYTTIPPAEAEADAEEERRDGWSMESR
jgi:hypothetical protein